MHPVYRVVWCWDIWVYFTCKRGGPSNPDPNPGVAADVVLGQQNFITNNVNGPVTSAWLYNPNSVFVGNGKTYVADTMNNRVLIWNTETPDIGQGADVVLGQVDFSSINSNQGDVASAGTLNGPVNVFSDGVRIFVSDQDNHRVLIWNTTSPTDGQAADVVLGQIDFTSVDPNQGGSVNSSTLYSPFGVFSDGSRIYVSDQTNARILIWNTVTPTNGQGADIVLGQADFESSQSNRGGGASSSTLSRPGGISVSSSGVAVSDINNHRILIWNTVTPTNGQGADIVLGQADFESSQSNRGGGSAADTVYSPLGVSISSSRICVADTDNHRVLIWNTSTPSDGQNADSVLGQAGPVSPMGGNRGSGVAGANTLSEPVSVLCGETHIYVADRGNNRVLIWNTSTPSDGQNADSVLGQGDFTYADSAHPASTTAYGPYGVFSTDTHVYVADSYNNRVLIYAVDTLVSGKEADIVLGQNNFIGRSYGVSESRLYNPQGVMTDGERLYVADTSNNRVLIWNTSTPATGAGADIVLGQTNFEENQANAGGSADADTLYNPSGVFSNGSQLFVVDQENNRVLIWNTATPSSGQAADVVLGQDDFMSRNENKGGGMSTTSSLRHPSSVWVYNDHIYVTDGWNRRTLIWNTTDVENGQDADVVIGQPDFESSNSTSNITTTAYTEGVYVYGDKLFVADNSNNRVMIWNTATPSNGQAADALIGSADFENSGGYDISSTTLNAPSGLAVVDGYVFVSDRSNNRILRFPFEVAATSENAIYFYSTSSTDWSDLSNWWLDVDHTVPASELPSELSEVYIVSGSVAPVVLVDVGVDEGWWESPASVDASDVGITFVNQLNELSADVDIHTIIGDVTASGTVYLNDVAIVGDVTLHGSAYVNSRWEDTASLSGNVYAYDNSVVYGADVEGDVFLYDDSGLYSEMIVTGDVYVDCDAEISDAVTVLGAITSETECLSGEILEPTNITKTSATLRAIIYNTGGSTVSYRGFVYVAVADMYDESALQYMLESGEWGTGEFTADITGLVCGTEYVAISFAQNEDNDIFYGEESGIIFFETLSCDTPDPSPTRSGGGASLIRQKPSFFSDVTQSWIPTGSLRINDGAQQTKTRRVWLYLPDSTATQMAISNSLDFSRSTLQPFTKSIPWTLTSRRGEKTVYVKLLSRDGVSTIVSDTIEYVPRVLLRTTDSSASTSVTSNPTVVKSFVFQSFLTVGSRGLEVLELQKKLQSLGFFPATVSPNGVYGPTTLASVIAFQKANRIDPLGYVGPATRAALNK